MKVLVAAASRHGATAEIAQAIGKGLAARGIDVTVADAARVETVEAYDAALIGSAAYVGRWLDDAKRLVERHGDVLARKPVWLFSSGPIGDPPKPEEAEVADVREFLEATGARGYRVFGGKLDKSKLGFGERALMLAFRVAEGDWRDWGAIDAWAGEIAGALSNEAEQRRSA